jgi:hypothetical protein
VAKVVVPIKPEECKEVVGIRVAVNEAVVADDRVVVQGPVAEHAVEGKHEPK